VFILLDSDSIMGGEGSYGGGEGSRVLVSIKKFSAMGEARQ